MLYEAIVETIHGVCESVNPTGTFIHGRRLDGSLAYDGPMPQIHLYPFITEDVSGDNDFERTNITMGFWFQGGLELSPEDAKVVIGQADILQRAFKSELKEISGIEISGYRAEPGYNLFMAILTGYTVTFTLTSKTSTC